MSSHFANSAQKSDPPALHQYRVKFDFEISFTNGGGIKGEDFRLDIPGEDISDKELADYIIQDMRLLMVGETKILNKTIFPEAHKRKAFAAGEERPLLVDLSHSIENGLITYKGLPAPVICDYLSREESRKLYAEGTEFQIGSINMVANTGTYVDCPFHRYEDGEDLADVVLERFADLAAVVIRIPHTETHEITKDHITGYEIRNRAVLLQTGWDKFWNTDQYFENNPFLNSEAAEYLRDCAVKLVGIDSLNIDDTRSNSRPVHSILLKAGILIVEHLCNLDLLPNDGFTFSAVPPKIKGMGTFPVRAFARMIYQ